MVPLHSLIVHFPVALLSLATVLYIAEFITRRQELASFGLLCLILGEVAAIAAVITGNISENSLVKTNEISRLTELHETLGMVTIWIFGMLLIWGILRRKKFVFLEKAGFVFLLIAATFNLAFSAHLGGRIIFEKGGGVAPMEERLREKLEKEKRDDEKKKPGEETVKIQSISKRIIA